MWDAATGRLERELFAGSEIAWCVSFAPDGQSLAAGHGEDVVLFALPEGDEIGRLRSGAGENAHGLLVQDVVFHPQRPWIVSSGLEGDVHVWDRVSLRRLGSLRRGGA